MSVQEVAAQRAGGGDIRSIGKHTLIYGLGITLSKVASFIMLPIYTRHLTPADYGVMELLATTIDVIGTLAGIGLANSVAKFYAEYNDPREKKEVLSTALLATLLMAVLVVIGGMLASGALSDLILKESGRPEYFRIFFLIYLLTTAEAIPLLYLRIRKWSRLFVAVSFSKLVGMLSLNIYLVVHLEMGVLGVLYSNLLVTAVSGIGLAAYMLRQTGIRFSLPKLKVMARFSYPVMFVFLGNFVLVFSDRYFLSQYMDIAEVGIYSLAYKFAFILTAFGFAPFNMVWSPQRFAIARRPDAEQVFSRVWVYVNVVLGSVALLIALFVKDFLVIMADPQFHRAHQVVAVLLAAQIIHHWTNYANLGLYLRNRTGAYARASYMGVFAVLALNFLLIPFWGIWGAAGATLLAYGVRFYAVNRAAQRVYPIDYRWSTITHFYLIVTGAIVFRAALPASALPISVAESALVFLLSLIATHQFILSADDRKALRGVLARSGVAVGLSAS